MPKQITLETSIQPIAARDIYPDFDTTKQLFIERVDSGEVSFAPAEPGRQEISSHVNLQSTTFYDVLDETKLPEGNLSFEDVLAATPDKAKPFVEHEHNQMLGSRVFDVAIAQSYGWWVPATKNDQNRWLETATLNNVAVLEVAGSTVVINDFDGSFDIQVFYDGLTDIASRLASEGLNIADYIKTINVLPEDNPRFTIPEHIKKERPDTFMSGGAGNKGQLILNARQLREEFHEVSKDGFMSSKGWGGTIYHEFAHLLNNGLNDSDKSFARSLGWRSRADTLTDDYGDMAEKSDFFGISYVTDDYGNELALGGAKRPQVLTGHETSTEPGEHIAPPTRYANENSSEDIAESFAVYALAGQLDSVRTRLVQDLIKSKGTLGTTAPAEVKLEQMNPATFRPLDYLPSTYTYREIFQNFPST